MKGRFSKRRGDKKDLASTGSLPKWLQCMEPGWPDLKPGAPSRSPSWVQGQNGSVHSPFLLLTTSRELGYKLVPIYRWRNNQLSSCTIPKVSFLLRCLKCRWYTYDISSADNLHRVDFQASPLKINVFHFLSLVLWKWISKFSPLLNGEQKGK